MDSRQFLFQHALELSEANRVCLGLDLLSESLDVFVVDELVETVGHSDAPFRLGADAMLIAVSSR